MRLYQRSAERRPDPPSLRTDDRATVLAGIAVWVVLGVLALVFQDRLEADGRGWWVWTPPVGVLLGLLGLRYVGRARRDGQGRQGA